MVPQNQKSLLFKLNPAHTNILERSLNLFFFYQGDVESLLSTHDYGLLKYEPFTNYSTQHFELQQRIEEAALDVSLQTQKEEVLQEEILQLPIFPNREQFLRYDFLNKLHSTLYRIEEMKLKDNKLLGALAKQISVQLLCL